jgi:hypothetical protein
MSARPSFLLDLRLHDLNEWWLRLECCGRTIDLPCRFLAKQKLQVSFGELLFKLRCQSCGARPLRVLLFDDPANNAGRSPEVVSGWRFDIALPARNGSVVPPRPDGAFG